MSSKISHSIKARENPKDVFITPNKLAIKHIEICQSFSNNNLDKWLDPFKNSGNYYNNFKTNNKDWCEILQGIDFFLYNKETDIICSNPPYSCIDKVLKKSIELKPKIISYLLAFHGLTTKRMELMEKAGYKIKNIFLTKVYQWYGMSAIITWVKTSEDSIINYDRTVWREAKH